MTIAPEVVHDPSSVAPEWDELADRTNAPPWLRPGWVLAWQRAFLTSKSAPELVCMRDGTTMRAALPLVRAGRVSETPSNSETPLSGLLAEKPDDLVALASLLFDRGDRRITLWPFERDAAAGDVVGAAREHGYVHLERVIGRSPYIPLTGSWDEYKSSVGSKVLAEIRRRRRRLEGLGELVFEVDDGRSDLAARLGEGLDVEAAGWKGRSKTAIASRAAARAFYEDVCAWAAARGMLRLAFVRLDGRPIAFDLCFEERGIHYLLKTSYEPEFASYGPGALIRSHMIERAFSLGLDRYEFLGHDEPWKHRWANDFHERVIVRFFAPTPAGRADRFLYERVRPTVRRALERVRRSI